MNYQERRIYENISPEKIMSFIRQDFVINKYKNKCPEALEKRDMVIFDNYIRLLEQKIDFEKKIKLLLKKINPNYTSYNIYNYNNCDFIISYLDKINKMKIMNKIDSTDIDFNLCNVYLFHYIQHNEIYLNL